MSAQTESHIETTLKNYISKTYLYDQPDFILTNDFPLFEQRVIDSMGIFHLISFMRDAFGISIQHQDMILENFGTITDISALVNRYLQQMQGFE